MSPEIKNFTSGKLSIDYATFGDGPRALIILPGMSMNSVLTASSSVARAFSMFKDTHTAYLIDRKKDIQPGYTVNDMAADTATLLKAIGISDADVYGASQGGMIALTIAIEHPELIHKLAVVSTSSRQNPTSIAAMDEWEELSKLDNPAPLNRSIFRKVYSQEYFNKYERAFEVLEKAGTKEDMRRFGIMAVATADFDIYDRLPEIKCPAVVFGMENDPVLSSQASKEIAEKLGCPYYGYPGTGHAVYDEDPKFPARLFDFFGA